MPTVQVRFAPPIHERFIAECEKRDITPSEFIRRAVEAMMDHLDTKAAQPEPEEHLGHHGPKARERVTIMTSDEQGIFRASSGLQLGPTRTGYGSRLKK